MLVSAVQQSDSVIHLYIFFFICFSIMVYHRILNIVLCAVLVVYPVPRYLDYYSFVVNFEIEKCESSNFVLFQDNFGNSEYLVFSYQLQLVNFCKIFLFFFSVFIFKT